MKAVIPAAGLGTRFLPATKAQPKEMLPVVDKPAIQYVVEEAVASGIDDILVITGRGKRAIEDHFDKSFELEEMLERANNMEALRQVRDLADLAHIHYIRQKHPLGLGNAVACARRYVGNDFFAVLLGDIITVAETLCTKQLIDASFRTNSSVIAVERIPRDKVSGYGIVEVEKTDEPNLLKVKGLIEKPSLDEAPSDLAIIGRYVLTPKIFPCLEQTKPGKNDEIQLTDALSALLETQDIYAFEVTGRRYDIGNKIDWLKATIELALDREDLGPDLREHLKALLCKD